MRLSWILCLFLLSTALCAIGPQSSTADAWLSPAFWSNTDIQKQFRPYPIVFIHGIAAGFEKWRPMATLIGEKNVFEMRLYDGDTPFHTYYGQKGPLSVWNLSYYTPDIVGESLFGNLGLYAARLEDMIERILILTQRDKVIVIAHSMGGLVARRYMTLNQKNWQKVDTLLTVGSPLTGVMSSPGIVGQLIDLQHNSALIQDIEKKWQLFNAQHPVRWGVVGGVMPAGSKGSITAQTTDWGGPGFSAIGTSIPYGEWAAAVTTLGTPILNTPHFSYRLAIEAQHEALLTHPKTAEAIFWAVGR